MRILMMLIMVFSLSLPIFSLEHAHAQDPSEAACQALGNITDSGACASGEEEVESTVTSIINILLFVVGVAAVIMIIVSGIRYVVSAGDQQAVASAKNAIIYSIIGLVIALMAFAIVNFVLERI